MATRREQRSAAAEQFIQELLAQEERDLKEHGEVKHVSTWRQVLPQLLASTAKNLILLDLGMTVAFPTIVIPVLLKSQSGLQFTTTQASWFGSIGFICQPLGSILSGVVLEPLGRKYSMLLVNFPQILGWLLFYSAKTLFTLFTAIIIMGLGVGFMEAPIITYVGEISEPRFRGTLTSYTGIFVSLGLVLVYSMANLTDWQHVAAISCCVPIITIIAISQVPETPLWLLSRGRLVEAEQSLCWLRGWVHPRAVRQELLEMIRYSESSKLRKAPVPPTPEREAYSNPVSLEDEKPTDTSISAAEDKTGNEEKKSELVNRVSRTVVLGTSAAEHETDWRVRLKDMLRPEMMRPLGLVVAFFFFKNASGINGMRPYFIKIFEKLNFPVSPLRSTVVCSVVNVVSTALCMATVRFTGKRPMALVSFFACAIATITIGVYTFVTETSTQASWLPFIMFMVLQFFTGYGVIPVPWMLVGEVFPMRGRSFASGVAAAASYILGFVATKTFLSLESALTLGGVFLLYGFFSVVGVVFLYFYLVETEGRSLEQIEQYFKTKK